MQSNIFHLLLSKRFGLFLHVALLLTWGFSLGGTTSNNLHSSVSYLSSPSSSTQSWTLSNHLSQERTQHPVIAVVTLVKDDPDILPHWLEYHTSLFGSENIAVINHDSQHNTTLKVMLEWSKKGIHLLYSNESYKLKGDIILHTFQTIFPHADLYLPLDIDEFVISYNRTEYPIANKTIIWQEFTKIWRYRQPQKCWGMVYNFNIFPMSIQDTMETIDHFAPYFRTKQYAKKFFVNTYDVISLDHGNHCPQMHSLHCLHCNVTFEIGLLHYHFRNPLDTAQRAIIDLIGWEIIDKNATLENMKNYEEILKMTLARKGTGRHKARELLAYLENGLSGLLNCMYKVYPKLAEVIKIKTIHELIENIKLS